MPHEFQLSPEQEENVNRRKILGELARKIAEAETSEEKDMWNKILAEVSLLSPEEAAPRLKELNEHLRDQDKTYPSKKRNEEEE